MLGPSKLIALALQGGVALRRSRSAGQERAALLFITHELISAKARLVSGDNLMRGATLGTSTRYTCSGTGTLHEEKAFTVQVYGTGMTVIRRDYAKHEGSSTQYEWSFTPVRCVAIMCLAC